MSRTSARIRDDRHLLDVDAIDRALQESHPATPLLRQSLINADQILRARFLEGTPAAELVTLRAELVDTLVTRVWDLHLDDAAEQAALVAVGGYGRGELHPGSDTDLLVVLADSAGNRLDSALKHIVTQLWDIGLQVGHSVRSLTECVREATQDITVATNLMESRLLAGSPSLYQSMVQATGPNRIWPSRQFFEAKWREQLARHEKHHDTAHNLEPNLKESPGGLRDIHMIGWVAKRQFGAGTLHDLVDHAFLTESEYRTLMRGQYFLWDLRFALHVLTGRREDRLLFDYQVTLAKQFGYRDTEHTLAVEQLMQRYYRTVMRLSCLNEMLLQLYQEVILYADLDEAPQRLNKRFQIKRGFIEVTHPNVFRRYPFALLEVFLLIQEHPEIKGVRAATIRLIRQHHHLIDERFRNDLRCRSLFMEILRRPRGITHELRRMHTYGILGRYLPAIRHITGRMQYDLFHAYTVDSHILMVVRNLRRFAAPEFAHEFPFCSALINRLPKPELLYLAGLFHDIAKGRGGDHSELGAEDAYQFCLHHGLSRYDSRLVAWLVRHHLLLSSTAQRRDISDPQVINEFACKVGDLQHLNYLYLLTIGDIRGTNPKLWNSWREALLLELYQLTQRAIRRGLGNPIDAEELISETQAQARKALRGRGLHHMTVRAIWRPFTADYFLRYSAAEIAWHTAAIHKLGGAAQRPLILIDPISTRGGTEVFVYTRDRDHIFALTVTALNQLGLDIQDARIITTDDGHTLDSYLVLEDTGKPIAAGYREREIIEHLSTMLCPGKPLPQPSTRTLPRRLRHFSTQTQIEFTAEPHNDRTAMELITGDRPGLLAQVGYAFVHCGVRLQNAKISTMGERAEDVFFLTDRNNRALGTASQQCLREQLRRMLTDEEELRKRADGV
ncbi:[protein-PII] uridylyltransferase [Nitrococcus mobilis]|uniref:Bifunctional uridylyltransferase/uridylyl-removing enzyme n=1 Tax=Nitrococcus mobilis Nb-231 TaxID=314278 RepID=A4BS20_9GAMM|nr:[protein-PII] uridylyltransferase [Nitrococcus mobilis]EAR21499.1 Protein-P-II uridylyltransferase [Nitrococcus mobilis Nb-231]